MVAPWKRFSPAVALRHGVRISTILTKASFWAVCYHYFGSEALLYVAAAWMFVLGVKDLTFARVRLSSLQNAAKRTRAYRESVTAELFLIALRLAALAALANVLISFNKSVAGAILAMSVCAGLWARETFIGTTNAFGTASLRIYVTFTAAAAAIASIIFFAENNLDPIHSAIWSLLIREAVTFFGYAVIALLGCFGVRTRGEDGEDDDEDGADALPVIAPDGREVRSAWKLLIADNVVHSRWRLMHFATRFVAHGILGPFGGVATRIAFSYGKPRPYAHHNRRIAIWKIMAFSVVALAMTATIVLLAERAGLLHALGIVVSAFIFRLVALGANLLFWRQLSPLVGSEKRLQLIRRRKVELRAPGAEPRGAAAESSCAPVSTRGAEP